MASCHRLWRPRAVMTWKSERAVLLGPKRSQNCWLDNVGHMEIAWCKNLIIGVIAGLYFLAWKLVRPHLFPTRWWSHHPFPVAMAGDCVVGDSIRAWAMLTCLGAWIEVSTGNQGLDPRPQGCSVPATNYGILERYLWWNQLRSFWTPAPGLLVDVHNFILQEHCPDGYPPVIGSYS